MATKTKPKKKASGSVDAVTLQCREKNTIALDLLGYISVDDAYKALEKLTFLLSFASARIQNVKARPLPAHIRAELEPIKSAAQKLSDLINPDQLTSAATLRLPQFTKKLWGELQEVVAQVDAAITASSCEGDSDGGALRKAKKEQLDVELGTLGKFYDEHVKSQDEGDRAEFINLCRKKISTYI